MHITVLRMGGASAGILGSSGADGDIVNNLKRNCMAFANEYRKPVAKQVNLEGLADEIDGLLRTLQVTSTLSESETDKLLDQLHVLMEKTSL